MSPISGTSACASSSTAPSSFTARSTMPRVSRRSGEQVEYTTTPPGRTNWSAEASSSNCSVFRSAMSSSDLRQRASGRRRRAPSPEQGASTRTRSKPFPTPGSRPSATCTLTGSPCVAWLTSCARCGATSTASTCAPSMRASAASSAVLPPGPAHRSSHRPELSPVTSASASARAMSWEPSSCTAARPSRTGASSPGSPDSMYTAYGEYLPSSFPVIRASSSADISPGRAARCTTGRSESAAKAASSSSSPTIRAKDTAIHRGWACRNAAAPMASVGASSASHSSAPFAVTARMTAFTNPFADRSAAATRCTVVSTAAWSSTRVYITW